MLARERTSYLCPSLLDRWHLQCAAGLELDGDGGPGGLALRSLMGLWSPALALPGWVCLLVGVSARLEHDSRAERFLPGPDGHVPFSFPRFAPRRLARTNLPLCGMFALRRGIYRCPNY
jgi:hypothetical protein